MPRDVFISHASEDHALAVEVCELLEQRDLTCWIAPRDVGAGLEWDEAILDAIELSHSFLLLLSANANRSSFVKNELNRAFSGGKPIVTFRMEEVMPGRSLELYLARHHWTDAFPPPLEPRVDALSASLKRLLNPSKEPASEVRPLAKPTSTPARKPIRFNGWMGVAAAALLGMAAMAVPALRHLRETPTPELRTDIVTPATDQPFDFALSPDGQSIAFVAKGDGESRLWLRSLRAATAQPLPGTEGASHPFWAPDSRSIGFFAAASLKRVDIGGGQPQSLAPVRADGTLAASWSSQGAILFGEGQTNTLRRVNEAGGKVIDIVKPNSERGWITHPQFLPDGQQFLFFARVGRAPGIYLSSLDGAAPKLLTADADFAPLVYLASGWLLWSKGGALTAQRLDIDGAMLTGQPHTLADNVGSVSVSVTGNVAYRTRTTFGRQFFWVDRSGAAAPVGDPDFSLSSPRVAPDGRRLAFTKNAKGIPKLWLLEGMRTSRLTFDGVPDQMPLWSPDGSKIVFSSLGIERASLHQRASSGAGEAEVLLSAANAGLPTFATSWSTDGQYLLYFAIVPGSGPDIWVLPMTEDRKPFVFISNPGFEAWGQFSPDGRWVAYQSDESGQNEIYVRPFVIPENAAVGASASGGQWPVSTAGGVHPMWRPDGKEIYYVSPKGEMMAAPIAVDGSAVVPEAPVSLFNVRIYGGGLDRTQGRQYDVAPDGRFLVNTEIDSGEAAPITLIQNWNPDAGK
jgi:eukaryotic-like serine/threonine-protein kinase